MTTGRQRAVQVLALTLVVASLAACGLRAAPVAPEVRVPQAVNDLSGVVRAGGIELSWTDPTHRLDGTRLHDLAVARLFRVEDDGTGEPKPAILHRGRIAGYAEVATVKLASPAPAIVAGARVTLRDTGGLSLGRRYTYAVLTADSLGRLSAPSRRATLTYIAAPEPPTELTGEAGEAEARLAWRAPTRLVDGRAAPPALAYEVLRAPGAEAPLVPIAAGPVTTTRFVDRGLENDRTYSYAVRAIRMVGETKAIGEPSPRIDVTPVDLTPPSPPRDLVAIPSERTVRLSWSPSPEADVAGYIIHRARGTGGFERIGATRVPTTVFVDRDVAPGRYRYVVTAEDTSSRRNESARSNEVTVSVP